MGNRRICKSKKIKIGRIKTNKERERKAGIISMDDMVFFKELIKRQARMMLGLELHQDAEEDKRIGYWVGRDDNKCAKGISFILEDDFVVIEMMIIKPDYRQEVLLDKTVACEDTYTDGWAFDDKVDVYTQKMQYPAFLDSGLDIYCGLVSAMWDIINDEFLEGVED